MARGVDSVAHSLALEGGGLTIAVLGCGVDVVYPPESRNLHQRIRERGAVVSELWLGAPPDRINFPRRNRIISGLSRAVIVTEAPLQSGAQITADVALKQGRDIYAVPGDITRKEAAGVNALIAEGARIVTNIDDLLVNLGLGTRIATSDGDHLGLPIAAPADLSPDERAVLESLSLEPAHVDVLAAKLARDTSDLLTNLTLMEMRGLVIAHAGSRFSRATVVA
jgi:DNA processing protein